jgi:transposase
VVGVLAPYEDTLMRWLKADQHRNKRERRGIKAMFEALRAMGYGGSRGPVYRFAKAWRQSQDHSARGAGFVPLVFEMGEAFQFDWSTEYAFIGGLRRRLEVAHTKLAASRAFVLSAFYSQAHEMLFEAHARAFAVLGGVPRRGIYDNMKTAVDKVGAGKQRSVNARFEAMTGHYLFDPEFCNRAAGWEKGIVEKNVQDRRRGIWREISERHWSSLEELNTWLQQACVDAWGQLRHPEWNEMSIADVWQDERLRLGPNPRPFDGYVEQPIRVTATSLINFQRNRYSVPCEWVHAVISLRAYHDRVVLVGPQGASVTLQRSFERDQTAHSTDGGQCFHAHRGQRSRRWRTPCAGVLSDVPIVAEVSAISVERCSALWTQAGLVSFLIDSPLRAILWEPCTIRSKMASASVGSSNQACHAVTGN